MTQLDPVQHARRWKTLAVLSLSLVIIGLDNTILNVALPTLQDEFDASASTLQWMVDSYLLVFAGLLLVFGTLGDRFGRKLALQVGVSVFGVASLAALVADSADQVIGVRACMGIGAALIMPATLSIIANVFTGKERGKAIAIWAALAAVGIGLGPLAGGLLLEWFSWPSVFLVNVPFAVAALLLGIRYVPESRDPRPGSFDLVGAALSTAGFVLLVSAIIEAPARGWTSAFVLAVIASAAALLAAFLWWERRVAEPMLDLGFFRSARFSVGTAAVSVAFFALLGAIFALTQYLQFAHGYGAIEAGVVMSPIALGLMIGAGSSSRAVTRLGTSRVVTTGLVGLAVVLALTTRFEADTPTLALVAWFFALSLAMGWIMAPATDAVVGAVPAAKAGVASATNTVARMVAGALGVAVVGSLVSSAYANGVEGSLSSLPADAQARAGESDGAASATAALLPAGAAADLVAAAGQAFTTAMGNGLLVAAAAAALAAAAVSRFLPSATEHVAGPVAPPKAAAGDDRAAPAHAGTSGPKGAPMPATHQRNLAARMGRWSAHHRKTAIVGWLGFVVAAFAVGTVVVGPKQATDASGPGESGRASAILEEGFKQPAGETVLIQSDSLRAGDPGFDAAIRDVIAVLVADDAVTNIRSPLDPQNPGQITADRRSALIDFQVRGDADQAVDKIDPILTAVAAVQTAHPRLFIGEFGDASADKELEASFMSDLGKAGLYSVPVTLIILIVVFGAFVAASIPLVLALTAVLATVGLWALPSQIWPSDESLYAMVLLIGLAVGVDYSMFYLKREREERAAGRSPEAALEAAAATSGRSVLISGATVIVAMGGMLFAGDVFAPFGIATMIVVAVAVLGSLTVLPAILSALGDGVDRLRVPFVSRPRRDNGEGRIWGAIIERVLRRPLLSLALSGGLLLAIAAPALTIHTAEPGIDTYPQGLDVLKAYNRLQAAFPGTEIPANVVVKAADINAADVQQAIGQLKRQALASGLMHRPIVVDVNPDATVANVAIPMDGTGNDGPSNAALAALRDEIIPATVGSVSGVEAAVGGFAAESKDSNDELKSVAPYVFAFVLGFAFLLLLVAFRSLVIAAKAIALNLLSVAAAYGILVLVFQHGWGKQLLGFETTGGIVPFLPIFLFVILFGLSMDYHVFILSRIREAYDGGASTEEAVAHGIKTTAGVITSAALVMVCVFSIFGVLSFMMFKQIGVGLAAAILIDATVVRAVLLPATMKLLGDWNWYLPQWLEWLPRLDHGGETEPVEAVPVPTTST